MYKNEPLNLEHLAEEAAEVIRIKSKCIRFGMDDYHHKNGQPNKISLAREIGHFLKMVNILMENKTISAVEVLNGRIEKRDNLKKWYDKATHEKYVLESEMVAKQECCDVEFIAAVFRTMLLCDKKSGNSAFYVGHNQFARLKSLGDGAPYDHNKEMFAGWPVVCVNKDDYIRFA